MHIVQARRHDYDKDSIEQQESPPIATEQALGNQIQVIDIEDNETT